MLRLYETNDIFTYSYKSVVALNWERKTCFKDRNTINVQCLKTVLRYNFKFNLQLITIILEAK